MTEFHWWQTGIIYQIYPRSFQDTTGSGIGDIQGIIDRLDYLNDGTPDSLGIDAIWISPFYPSPMADAGYDVADYCDVEPLLGDLETFDRLVVEAHKRNIKVIVDYVPNHTSDEHPWFIESRSSKDSPKRDWYIWREADSYRLPNNWGSMFGGPAWAWDKQSGEYYFHQFHHKQPDLNWRNPDVKGAMLDVLRFWLDRGVDGFRMDVVYLIWKHPDMPDQPFVSPQAAVDAAADGNIHARQQHLYDMNYDGIHDIMREMRDLLDEYGDTVAIGEIWLDHENRARYYGENNDGLHLPFNFDLITEKKWDAARIRRVVDRYIASLPEGGTPNYVLGNHDVHRVASRFGAENARSAALLLLTLEGTPTIYMGDELGLTNGDVPVEKMQDPQVRVLGPAASRDVVRTPMQWDDSPYAGFSTVEPWLPVSDDYQTRNVKTMQADSNSILSFYRRLIWLRKANPALNRGSYTPIDGAPDGIYVYQRAYDGSVFTIVINFTGEEKQLTVPAAGKIALSTRLDREELLRAGDTLTLRPHESVIVQH